MQPQSLKSAKKINPLRLMKQLSPTQWHHTGVAGFLLPPSKHSFVRPENLLLPESMGRIGSLEVRLARTAKEVRRAQRLRYKVFYEEMAAIPNAAAMLSRRDMDAFDEICDHLLVIDHDPPKKVFGKKKPKVVGTYRLLRKEVADRYYGFYTASEYDIEPILKAHKDSRILELGRSCVLKPYRNKRTVEMLWHGLWVYITHHRIDLMLGCASLEGIEPDELALPLAFLHHHARAPEALRAKALPSRYVDMDRMPASEISARAALQELPPLVKGYLRLGASFGDGAVVDRQFGTTDVFVVLPVSKIDRKYIEHYGALGMAN